MDLHSTHTRIHRPLGICRSWTRILHGLVIGLHIFLAIAYSLISNTLPAGTRNEGRNPPWEGRKAYSAVYLSLGYAFSCLISQRALSRSRVTSSIQHASESRTGCCRYGERHLEGATLCRPTTTSKTPTAPIFDCCAQGHSPWDGQLP